MQLPDPYRVTISIKKNSIMTRTKNFDVIIIGGSYAGLSAAMALGRSLRKTLIIDSGKPCNRTTPHSHNFLTQDGKKPAEISGIARLQVEKYPTVRVEEDLAISGKKNGNSFEISTQSGKKYQAGKLIFATGIRDEMPDIKGFSDCWGISVIHCPYCHGYEFRGQKTALMANGEKALHLAPMIRNLTDQLTILPQGKADFTPEQIEQLNRHNIQIVETVVTEIEHEQGHLKQLVFADGQKLPFDAAYAALPFQQHSDIPVALGCALNEHGYLQVDPMQQTSVDGIFACGDNTSPMRSVANAVASGNIAGAVVNMVLTKERF